MNFNIRSVKSAEGYCAVEHQLHVTGAAGFGTGKRNLLADIGGRHEPFRRSDVVILNINNLESASDVGIVINKVGKGNNEADDLLCHKVARSGLCAENISVRNIVSVGIRLDFKILCNNLESVEVLALIFMQALHLNVEN